jgi:(4-alkanoyl-5-oxo-2,5-dihydrofuran-3-yl)methyl phosphate reductase
MKDTDMTDTPLFLVTGATGTVGSALTSLLGARGASVRAMARHPERGALPAGVEPCAADFDDPASITDALAGVRRVFLLTGGPDGPRHDQTTAEAAAEAGVEYLVKLSVLGISEDADDPVTRWHRAGEDAVRCSGVPCGFIRPGAFMSNALNWAPSIAAAGTVAVPFADLPVAPIEPLDIAAVAYHLLTRPEPSGTAHPITGPEAITPRQQVNVLSDLLARSLHIADLTAEQARDQFTAYGTDPELADAIVATMAGPLNGHGSTPTTDVEHVTGLPARSFRQWAATHLADFAAPAESTEWVRR